MFEVFEKYIKAKISISDQELDLVRSVCTEKKLYKKQFILREGEICRHNCFVARGCLRMYRIGDDASLHMLRFAIENWWMSDRVSLTTGQPSLNHIDALEDSEILLWTTTDFNMLTEEIPLFRNYIDELLARSFNASQHRIYTNISATAEEKYINFIKAYPDFFHRVPLNMIASYLGVSSKTLSRIRQQFAHHS